MSISHLEAKLNLKGVLCISCPRFLLKLVQVAPSKLCTSLRRKTVQYPWGVPRPV